jgi:3-phenylpropionate/trans-cinnamate dioxygenase ferredoxin reductase subunit
MSSEDTGAPKGPDLLQGIDAASLADGQSILGHAEGEPVLLARKGDEIFAVSASCTHYGGPLAEGLIVGDTVRCPLHHACFDLRTGVPIAAPALEPIACWNVERRGKRLVVLGKAPRAKAPVDASKHPSSVVIVGGGAAGHAAAEMLRREGYEGPVTIISADEAPPVDRPNLSKDYLAGTAPEEWIPLRPPQFFAEHRLDLVLGKRVTRIDRAAKRVEVDGGSYEYGALLLATGAEPVKLGLPGAERAHVHYLRTLADSRAIISRLAGAKRAVVIGASFIGLEVAASLRERGLEVHVVAPDARPLEPVLGPDLGDFVQRLHEEHGVIFHMRKRPAAIAPSHVVLNDEDSLPADLVVVGIGVQPVTSLAEDAGLALDRGIAVDEHLRTSDPNIFAAGDSARWPDLLTGQRIRVEHWVVAERQGQVAARNILGKDERCRIVPFFWSKHYDVSIHYVGHGAGWDQIQIDGSLAKRDARVSYLRQGRVLAVATLGRDLESLRAERELEGRIAAS